MNKPARKTPTRNIPQDMDGVTPAWCTEAFGSGLGGKITAVNLESIGDDVGFTGRVWRCHLTWSEDSGPDLPASVIVKVPTKIDANFALGDGLRLYEREIEIYRKLAPTLGIRMPKLYFADLDPDPAPWLERPVVFLFEKLPIGGINWLFTQFLKVSGKSKRRYILIIEDITDARPPAQRDGASLDDALAALKVLAGLHATNWMRADAPATCPQMWPFDRTPRIYQANYVRNRDAFIAHFGDRISEEMLARLDEIHTRIPEINTQLTAAPWTVLHGDYRLDNLLFRDDGDIVVLDHQNYCWGRPGFDVAYFITTALSSDHRPEEEHLLQTYHDALTAGEVVGYSLQQLRADYEMAKESLAHRIAGSADILITELADEGDTLTDVFQLRVLSWLP